MAAVASTKASGSADPTTAVSSFGVTYTNWEASSIYMCDCDYGVYGADCSRSE